MYLIHEIVVRLHIKYKLLSPLATHKYIHKGFNDRHIPSFDHCPRRLFHRRFLLFFFAIRFFFSFLFLAE